tara:strand:+ start:54 stop:743 length:690 start_codon:yes stop_codon:yes gene_type:complete
MRKTKKFKQIQENYNLNKTFLIEDAVEIVKKLSTSKFDESIDISVQLGIDAKKTDQLVRGVLSLPKGSEKKIRIAVFATGDDIELAKKAGADVVGGDDLIEEIKSGKIDFEKCISTPDMMPKVGALGQVLGPKGLMPNPKLGTVTKKIDDAIKNIKSGQIEFKTDKSGIVHASIGKSSFSVEDIVKNIKYFYQELSKTKPSTSKGIFLKKMYLNSTMGPGLKIDMNSVT